VAQAVFSANDGAAEAPTDLPYERLCVNLIMSDMIPL